MTAHRSLEFVVCIAWLALGACSAYDARLLAGTEPSTGGKSGQSGSGGAGSGGSMAMRDAGGNGGSGACDASTCDPDEDAGMDCPTLADCDDGQPCTRDSLVDSTGTCPKKCRNTAITEVMDGDGCCPAGASQDTDADCSCGNGTLDPGEDCDGEPGCTDCTLSAAQNACTASHATSDLGSPDCRRCACINCTAEMEACLDDADTARRALCDDLVVCALAGNCAGNECYCGPYSQDNFCFIADGPCIPEIEAAAGSNDLGEIQTRSTDDNYAVGRGLPLSNCAKAMCPAVCPQ